MMGSVYCRSIKEKPYGSVAATFYLLAEAERQRKQQSYVPYMLSNISGLGGMPNRKISMPAQYTNPL